MVQTLHKNSSNQQKTTSKSKENAIVNSLSTALIAPSKGCVNSLMKRLTTMAVKNETSKKEKKN